MKPVGGDCGILRLIDGDAVLGIHVCWGVQNDGRSQPAVRKPPLAAKSARLKSTANFPGIAYSPLLRSLTRMSSGSMSARENVNLIQKPGDGALRFSVIVAEQTSLPLLSNVWNSSPSPDSASEAPVSHCSVSLNGGPFVEGGPDCAVAVTLVPANVASNTPI